MINIIIFTLGILSGMIIMDYLYYKKSRSTIPYIQYIKNFFKKLFCKG